MVLMLWPFTASAIELAVPPVGLHSVPLEIEVNGVVPGSDVALDVGGARYLATADDNGAASFPDVSVSELGVVTFLAIAVALLIRNVVPALVLGLWVGAMALRDFTLPGAGKGLLDVFAVYISSALYDTDRVAIILFTMMIGGMVGIITRNGGMASIVQVVVSKARTAVGGQVSVWLMGLMIFFDDYANTLVVGNTARPITDHLRISREKLAYIVDSTAAPVVCLFLVTTSTRYSRSCSCWPSP
jgi:hypothetical protein